MLKKRARAGLIVAALALVPAVAAGQQSPTPKGTSKGASGTTAPGAEDLNTTASKLKKADTRETPPPSSDDMKNPKRR